MIKVVIVEIVIMGIVILWIEMIYRVDSGMRLTIVNINRVKIMIYVIVSVLVCV